MFLLLIYYCNQLIKLVISFNNIIKSTPRPQSLICYSPVFLGGQNLVSELLLSFVFSPSLDHNKTMSYLAIAMPLETLPSKMLSLGYFHWKGESWFAQQIYNFLKWVCSYQRLRHTYFLYFRPYYLSSVLFPLIFKWRASRPQPDFF